MLGYRALRLFQSRAREMRRSEIKIYTPYRFSPARISIYSVLLWLLAFNLNAARADDLEIFSPDTQDRVKLELGEGEMGELDIYLKSFGDIVGGFKVTVQDDRGRQVGKNISDMFGIAKFTNLPPGRFRVFVESKMNDRGGQATVSIGDLKLTKIRK